MTDKVDTELLEPEVDAVSDAPETQDSKTFDNETVQKIVKRERQKAYEKAKREILQMQQEQEQMPVAQPEAQAPAQAPASLGGMQQMSQEDIAKLISQQLPQHLQAIVQQAQQQQQEAKNQEMINGFVSKLKASEDKFPGLEEKLANYDYTPGSGMTEIVMAANQLDNTADIMKEVTDHPNKMANLIMLATKQPFALQQAMQALSESIKRNQDAVAQEQQSNDPMSRLKPSPQAGIDNGSMSVNDFRQMFRG